MSPEAHLANVLYDFANYVEAAVKSGLTDGVVDRAHAVQDVALRHIVEEFRESA